MVTDPLNKMESRGQVSTVWKKKFFSSENKILLLVITTISFSFLIVAYAIYINYHNSLNNNYDRFANMMYPSASTNCG